MTGNEATDLAVRLSQTFPKGPPADAWETTIVHLEAGAAGTAYVRLAQDWSVDEHHGRSPGIADLMQIYRSLHVHDASTRPKRSDCAMCQNTGDRPVPGKIAAADGTTIERDVGVEPCSCPWGQPREAVHANILSWNANELDRLFPNRPDRQNPRSAA